MSEANKGFDFDVFKRVLRLAVKRKKIFYTSIFVSIVLALASSTRPIITKHIIDDYITKSNYEGFILGLILVSGVLVLEVILQFFLVYFANLLAQDVVKNMRDVLFKKLISFRLSFFDKTPNGLLVTRSVSDIETVSEVLKDVTMVFMGDFTRIAFVIVFMFLANWKLSVLVLSILPLMIIVTRYFQIALKKVFQVERTLTAKLNSFVQERLSGMSIVQLFNREKAEYEKFKAINGELKNAYVKTIFYFALLFPVVELVASFAIAAVVVGGGISTIYFNDVSPGDVFAFILFVNMLVKPIRQIAERFNSIQRGLVSARRVFALIDTDNTIEDIGQKSVDGFKGEISFKNVRFSYDDKEIALKGISFDAKPGQTIAIVGATGAGKSTIISLLNRFYEINDGDILIDNISIKDYKLECLRENIATVTQEVFLFNDTIYKNIVLGKKGVSKEQVIRAAKEIGIHDFINSLPNGYDQMVKERGGELSSGQRQLISFLRAYVFNPSILVLDEATSSIDTISEILIQNATSKITQERTSIVVAHRLATIQNADKIIVLDKGMIVENGIHKELIAKKGFYKKLYDAQFSQRKPA